MAANKETISEYFDRYDWDFEYDPETTSWYTGFRGNSSNFNIIVHLADNWLYFAINPFVNAARAEECTNRLNQHLLRLNNVINMAKFSLDGEGDVVLTVELPIEDLQYTDFVDGINALCFYADNYFLDVLNLAQNPDYEPTVSLEEPLYFESEENGSEYGAN